MNLIARPTTDRLETSIKPPVLQEGLQFSWRNHSFSGPRIPSVIDQGMQIDRRRSQRADHVGSKKPPTKHAEVVNKIFRQMRPKSLANWKTKADV